jgi:hypothetical protein
MSTSWKNLKPPKNRNKSLEGKKSFVYAGWSWESTLSDLETEDEVNFRIEMIRLIFGRHPFSYILGCRLCLVVKNITND